MDLAEITRLLTVVEKKHRIDQDNDWCQGSPTYLNEIKKELAEVEEEIHSGRICYLEDELGDVLWDYLNLLVCLASEQAISPARVFKRAADKYSERISGIEAGVPWARTKARQKERLAAEHQAEQSD
ncbi:MAG: nucleotide pyrophosphohydrolase [Candidatus Latescibacteria bacterium]|nr:nucleotide pyrophosphohydrolase [Candidatus Latescibacterota bacterium]